MYRVPVSLGTRDHLLIEQHLKILDKLESNIKLAHVKEAPVSPHHNIIMSQDQCTPCRSCVARDSTDDRHREREEIREEAAEV